MAALPKKKKKKEKGNGVLVSRSSKTNEKYTNSFTLLPLRSQSLRFCTVVDHRRLKGIFPFEPYTHTRKRERERGEGGPCIFTNRETVGVLCSYRHSSGSERQSLTEMMVRCAVCGSKMISIGDTWFAITIVEYYGRPSPLLLLFHFFFPPPCMYHPVQPSVAHDAFHPEHVCILSPSPSLSFSLLSAHCN